MSNAARQVPLELTDGIYHHAAANCDGPPCPFHSPSDHPLVDAPMTLRRVGGPQLIERLCVHGYFHPDPDSLAWLERGHAPFKVGRHDCDGCCEEVDPLPPDQIRDDLTALLEELS